MLLEERHASDTSNLQHLSSQNQVPVTISGHLPLMRRPRLFSQRLGVADTGDGILTNRPCNQEDEVTGTQKASTVAGSCLST